MLNLIKRLDEQLPNIYYDGKFIEEADEGLKKV